MKTARRMCLGAVIVTVCAVAFLLGRKPAELTEEASAAKVKSPMVQAVPTVAKAQTAVQALAELPTNQTATVRGTKPYVLASEVKFDKSLRLAAESTGARTIGVKSAYALLVEATPEVRARLAASGLFASVEEFHPSDKIAPRLAAAIKGGAESVETGIVTLTPEDHQIVQERVVAMGGEILTGCLNDGGIFKAKLSAGRVAELATCGDVRWLELFVRPRFANNVAHEPLAMNVSASWKSEENPDGLSGKGQTVTTSDTGIDLGHSDLSDRVVGHKVVEGCSKTDVNGHGTHTAGSIVGTGAMWANETETAVRGMAWGAELWAWFCDGGSKGVLTPNSMAELFRPAQEKHPAYIHSASWGMSTKGEYTSECVSLDRYVWENPDFLPVFAAGNDGWDYKFYEVVYGSIGSPAAAKNVLAVGATQNLRTEPEQWVPDQDGNPVMFLENGNPEVTSEFSSRGPCKDGRIKPDIATPGTGVLSTRSRGVNYSYGIYDDYYAYDSGTSMACPLMAGAVALVREWLVDRRDFTNEPPSAALMKAVVTGGAKNAPVPNNDQGWGRFDLTETLFPSNRAVHLIDRIPFESEIDFAWVVETTNSAPLDVQLAWVDYPALSGDDVEPKLINDLDLTVERLNGDDATVLYGNGGSKPDELNNIESVRVASAEPNRYLITVACKNVLYDYTDGGAAALYIRGAFDPEEVEEVPPPVRIRETDVYYRALDKALAEVEPGQTIEVLDTVRLRKSCTVTNSCTIVATNVNAWASPVTYGSALRMLRSGSALHEVTYDSQTSTGVIRGGHWKVIDDTDESLAWNLLRDGAALIVTNGASVTFSNVAFSAQGDLAEVKVFGGSCARLASPFGINRIKTDDYKCLELTTVITNLVEVDCLNAPWTTSPSNYVAWSSLSPVDMSSSANHLLYPFDDERGGSATAGLAFGKPEETLIIWQDGVPVPDIAAEAKLGQSGSEELVNFRTLSALINNLPADGDVTAYLVRDTTMTNLLAVGRKMSVISEEGNLLVDPSDDASFTVVAGGTLTFSNVTFSSRTGLPFVTVDGGEFTLEDGACLSMLDGDDSGLPGAVAIMSGTMTMRPGSSIIGCSAIGSSEQGGGAIWMFGEGCVLNLEGGRISGCSVANGYGGGVFANLGSEINLSGPLTVYGNSSRNGLDFKLFDDIYAPYPYCDLTLKGDLTDGRVGLSYAWGRPGAPDPFIVNEVGTGVSSHTLVSFVCEDFASYDDQYVQAEVSDDGASLVWGETVRAADTERTDNHVAQIVREGGAVTNYFEYIDGPDGAFAAIDQDGLVVELLDAFYMIDMYETIPVEHEVTLRLADEVEDQSYAPVYRVVDCGFEIVKGGKLTVDGVEILGSYGSGWEYSQPLLWAKGGELVLTNGAVVANVYGIGNRASGAVTVSADGVFTMTEGTEIVNCVNDYRNNQDQTGVGAALLVDKGTAYLRGGTITDNNAYRAAGVFIGNEGVAYVSGDLFVKNNQKVGFYADPSDFAIEEHGQLYLDGDLTGMATIGIEDGIQGKTSNTNVFGRVSENALEACGGIPGATNYMTSAAKFFRDDNPKIIGKVVTNETEALLVWSTAIVDGVFVDNDGKVYGAVSAARIEVPSAVPGLVYDGNAKTGVVETAEGYWLEGNVATNAGTYKATVYLEPGYLWPDGSAMPKEVTWSIGKAVYDMSGITFEDATFTYDGQPKSIFISGDLPAGVTTNYIGNGVVEVYPWYEVRVKFYGDETNYEKIPDMVAHITIKNGDDPDPQWEVVTNQPTPIAFKSIDRVGDTEWSLVITDRVEFCNYRLLWTDDLTKGFTSTGDWEQAHAEGPWTTNVITTGGIWFWRAEGTEGTNMVIKTEE